MLSSRLLNRSITVVGIVLLAAAPAFADLKMTQALVSKGPGPGGTTTSTSYIKGLKMRIDSVSGDTTRTMIFDIDAQKMYLFDSTKKEVDAWDMAEFGKQMGGVVDTSGATASVKATGQTKQIQGRTAAGYDMNITMPMQIGDAKDGMKMNVALTGPIWVVKGAPGTDDYLRFYQAAAEKGWIFSDPGIARRAPGQARAMTEMYRQLAATGGVPYETEMNIRMGGEGPMAAMMAKMGGISTVMTVQTVDTATLAADLFAPPAGYTLNPKK